MCDFAFDCLIPRFVGVSDRAILVSQRYRTQNGLTSGHWSETAQRLPE